MNYCRKYLLYVLGLLIGFNLTAYGQSIDTQAIEEVVVTATRRDQALTNLALSVGVLNQETIQFNNADHPAEILALVPGVNIQRGSGAEHLTSIRSPVLTGGAGAGSFLYLQDGVPLRSAGFGNTNGLLGTQTEMAEQIEIIRGPSGPIYGANAVHGVINVMTPKPVLVKSENETAGYTRLSADSQSRYKSQTTFSESQNAYGWIGGLALTKEKGYREDAGIDEQKSFFRHVYTHADTEFDSILSIHNLNQETAGFIYGEEALNNPELRKQNDVPNAYRDAYSLLLQSNIAQRQSSSPTLSITPFARWHKMEFLQHFLPGNAVENNDHWSLGLQSDYSFSAASWNLLAGVDLDYTEGSLREFQASPTVFSYTQGLHYDYEVDATSISGFVQFEYGLSETLKTLAGLRLDYTNYDYNNLTDDGVVGRFLRPADRKDSFTTTSPKITLQYQPNENVMGYISIARAHRPPQTSDLYRLQVNQTEDGAKAEKMDAIELGIKTRFGERLSMHIASFAMEKENFFFRDADGFNVNNGRTQHRGVELDLEVKISNNLNFNTAISYAKHTYDFDRIVSRDYELIEHGNEVDTAPEMIANTRLAWNPGEKFYLELQWALMGEYFTDAANLHSYEGYDVFNLRTQYRLNPKVDIAFTVRNLTDELYAERADFAFGEERFFPAETRTVAMSVSLKF